MVRRRAIAGAACVHLAAMRAVSNPGGRSGLAAILRDALASLGLLRMRLRVVKDSQALRVTDVSQCCCRECHKRAQEKGPAFMDGPSRLQALANQSGRRNA